MNDDQGVRIQEILQRAKVAHGAWAVYSGGEDDHWAGFYAAFIVDMSPIAEALGESPGQDQTVIALRALTRAYQDAASTDAWPKWYAQRFADALEQAGRA